MQQALPYKAWDCQTLPLPSSVISNPASPAVLNSMRDDVKSVVKENAVIVFGMRGCCLSHVVRRLLLGLGVNPAVYEVDEDEEPSIINDLENLHGAKIGLSFPTVFIGGRWFGGLDQVIATHITGELTPILKEAGALWL